VSPSANPVCAGNSVTFTATPTNGGSSPSYQWKVNGSNAGTNSDTYSYVPLNNDVVTVELTSNATCATGSPASSAPVTMTVNPLLPVSVTVSPSANPVCTGTSVTFTATPSNGGSSPQYQWKVNGINAGTNLPTYSYTPLNGDLVSCLLTSSEVCTLNNPALSNSISMAIVSAPVVTFSACFDTITIINAKPIILKGGIPLGGIYSGPGVNSLTGIFTPSAAGVGINLITYTYTNSVLCSASKSKIIVVQTAPSFTCGNLLNDIRDSKVYQTVQIGSQCWMTSNLNYGAMIMSSAHQRDNCIPEKYCFNDLASNCQLGSIYYQWDEIMQYNDMQESQGLCPPGWHIPSESEWNTLFANYTNNGYAGTPLKNLGISGFNAFMVGVKHLNNQWDFWGFSTFFWSSTPHGVFKAWAHGMNDTVPSVSLYPSSRSNAFSVRCIKDT
jgi:uncharacterized protein (TIGR02145 family)